MSTETRTWHLQRPAPGPAATAWRRLATHPSGIVLFGAAAALRAAARRPRPPVSRQSLRSKHA